MRDGSQIEIHPHGPNIRFSLQLFEPQGTVPTVLHEQVIGFPGCVLIL